MALPTQWQLVSTPIMPTAWVETVQQLTGCAQPPHFGAQLLWQRGIQTVEQLQGFLNPDDYSVTSPFEFGSEMDWAIERLMQAREKGERVTIWGDFDADGITATAVLWDGLGQFLVPELQLTYLIPNRLKESHGLSLQGLDQLFQQGTRLIVTCDTGSTNLAEIAYAHSLGIEIIITDHHTLPSTRPDVVAILNSRYFQAGHPLADLSGVAVAFKLVEALYQKFPHIPQRPLHELLDLVAIGLIADLVQLRGDCRYLAQKGIQQLQTHQQNQQDPSKSVTRPGIARLLELCRRTGDRPTDISFGLGPRINAVSRIHGDARFCVELLTSQDVERCRELAEQTELANARRKALQNDVLKQVQTQLQDTDLSTDRVIVLADAQWPGGVLGIVAGQIAQEYGKPTILFTLDEANQVARGSARSVNQIDLYELVAGQSRLLTGFGGHPLAAGMSLPLANLPVFKDAINRQLRESMAGQPSGRIIQTDLVVTVSALGQPLFKELSLLEPCGMGNPVPKLLIRDAWFENVWHQKIKEPGSDRKLQYIKTHFLIKDVSTPNGFPGLWWGHTQDDLPPGRWDVIAELDFNSFSKQKRPQSGGYEIRLIDIRPAQTASVPASETALTTWVIDQRPPCPPSTSPIETDWVIRDCPAQWQELRPWWHQAIQAQQPIVFAYSAPDEFDYLSVWKTLVGIAKYLSRTGEIASAEQLQAKLQIGQQSFADGLQALQTIGFQVISTVAGITISGIPEPIQVKPEQMVAIRQFLSAMREEQFQRRYFHQVAIATAQAVMKDLD